MRTKCIMFAAAMLMSGAASAASVTVTDGPVNTSALRNLSNDYGRRASDWTSPPAPGQANESDHQGRAAGYFEDRGRGGIDGEVLVGKDGTARLQVQDLYDADSAGKFSVKVHGEWRPVEVERRANGNIRGINIEGLKAGYRAFKLRWVGVDRSGSGPQGPQDGYGVRADADVCR